MPECGSERNPNPSRPHTTPQGLSSNPGWDCNHPWLPEHHMVVKATGNQWYWNYSYPDEGISFDSYMIDEADLKPGQTRLLSVDNPMVVPEGTRVKILVTGNDVMHSFFVPSLAVQVYAFLGRTNEVWIDVPVGNKTYYGQCNQICGVNHAYMPIEIQAISKEEYAAWVIKAKEQFGSADQIRNPENLKLASVN